MVAILWVFGIMGAALSFVFTPINYALLISSILFCLLGSFLGSLKGDVEKNREEIEALKKQLNELLSTDQEKTSNNTPTPDLERTKEGE